jgi:hypothetical protein
LPSLKHLPSSHSLHGEQMSVFKLPRDRYISPSWTDVKFEILRAESTEQLTHQINLLVGHPNYHVLEVGDPTTTATFCAEPFMATLMLQERTNPNEVKS